ncbi:MAG: hypothetical protein KC421_24405 [Anaerolineales bacterium]|nr:hypothetical protein [Anaerolineales bacterium]
MGWENRGNGRYYYIKQRHGRYVTSQYIGRGEVAEAIAILEEMEMLKREQERQEKKMLREKLNADKDVSRQLHEMWQLTGQMVTAVLLLNGYHTHKGQWRKWQKS